MSSAVPVQLPTISFRARSLGTKFFTILLLALGMSISGIFVDNMVKERANNHGVGAALQGNQAPKPTTVFGVKLADSYRAIHRSLHYITLFLGLVFVTYFIFEALTGKSVHAAQYALVGVAQVIFYLLLLSLSEHLGFDWSFLIAGASTVLLFASNTDWIFGSRKLALRALAAFTVLYSFIYVLLRIEAYALLTGAIASFVAVAAAMYCTRHVDWYRNTTAAELTMGASAPVQRESWLK